MENEPCKSKMTIDILVFIFLNMKYQLQTLVAVLTILKIIDSRPSQLYRFYNLPLVNIMMLDFHDTGKACIIRKPQMVGWQRHLTANLLM